MNKKILVLLVAAIGFSGCRKEEVVVPTSDNSTVIPQASFKNDDEPKISILGNFNFLSVKNVAGNNAYLLADVSVEQPDGSVKLIGSNIKLNRQGNSPNYKSDNLNYNGVIAGRVIQIKVVETNFAVLLAGRAYVENSGNTLTQNPRVRSLRVDVLPDGRIYSKVSVEDDPAQETDKVTFCLSPLGTPTEKRIGICCSFTKVTQGGNNTSTSNWETTIDCFSYYSEEKKQWICEDNLSAEQRTGTLTIYSKTNPKGTAQFVDDWQGETAF